MKSATDADENIKSNQKYTESSILPSYKVLDPPHNSEIALCPSGGRGVSDASWVFLHIGEHILPAILFGDNMRRILEEKKGAHGYLQRPSTTEYHQFSWGVSSSGAQSARMSRSQKLPALKNNSDGGDECSGGAF